MPSTEVCFQCERELAEQQEKNTRLQTQLTQAEHKASTASQQVHVHLAQATHSGAVWFF